MTDARHGHTETALTDAEPPTGFFEQCGSQTPIASEIKSGHGGARAGAGRPKKRPPQLAPVEDADHWYCVHTAYGGDHTADVELRLAGFLVFNPMVWLPAEARRRVGAKVYRAMPDRVEQLFQRYMFVALNLADPDWRRIIRLPAVDSVISHRCTAGGLNVPSRMPLQAIALLRERCDLNDCIYPEVPETDLRIAPGAAVRIAGGPYAERFFDAAAICRWSAASRVALLLRTLEGQEIKLTLPREDVVAV